MSMNANGLPPLTQRATELVEYLVRYTLLITPILERRYPESSPEALRKFLERLSEDEWIVRHQLPGATGVYWTLSSRACNRLALKRKTSALRQGPLIRHCLQNLYFDLHPHLRLLTSTECKEALPQIYRRGSSSQYFLNTEDSANTQLGWLLVDDGKKPLRVWSKAKEIASTRKANPALYQLCVAGAFRIAIATTTEAKAEKIRNLFDNRPLRDIAVDVQPVGQLLPSLLVAGKGR